jgi:short-subunit dehydrogenase
MLLEGKTAVIYGGGGSIGGAVARAFAREGASVFLAGRTEARLEQVAEDIRAAGGRAAAAPRCPGSATTRAKLQVRASAQENGIRLRYPAASTWAAAPARAGSRTALGKSRAR